MPADWNVRLAHSPRHGGYSRRYTHKSVQRKIKGEEVKSLFNLINKNKLLMKINHCEWIFDGLVAVWTTETPWRVGQSITVPFVACISQGEGGDLSPSSKERSSVSYFGQLSTINEHIPILGAVHFIRNWKLDIPLDIVGVDYYLSNLSIAQAGALWKESKEKGSNLNLLPKFCDSHVLYRWLVGLN